MTLTLEKLQMEHEQWVKHNFPDTTAGDVLLGVVEEVGELCHAHLKSVQNIRQNEIDTFAQKVDAISDIIIYLVHYCNLSGICMQTAISDVWAKVSYRDWKKFPNDGVTW